MKENNNVQPNRGPGVNRSLFKDTLSRALLADDAKKLRNMCDMLCEIAVDRNLSPADRMTAIRMIMERVDGKPKEYNEDSDVRPPSGLFKIVKAE